MNSDEAPLTSSRAVPWAMGWLMAWVCIVIMVMVAVFTAYRASERAGMAQLDEVAYRQMDLYASTLENELGKHAYLPSLIEIDQDVVALFVRQEQSENRELVNRKLASMNVRASAMTIFLIGSNGLVLASSDWDKTDLGGSRQLSSLPFFEQALLQGKTQFFAANLENGSSEYYFTQAFIRDKKLLGVIGVKISLAPLEASWIDLGVRSESEDILVVDDNGVVIMSSVPAWKYHTLAVIPAKQILALERLNKYPNNAIKSLEMRVTNTLERGIKLVELPLEKVDVHPVVLRTLQERPMAQLGWKLVIISDPSEVWRNASYAAWGGGAITAFIGLLALYLLQRKRAMSQLFKARNALQQINGRLEDIVGQRTLELSQSNQELLCEMRDRKLAEEELVQAGKLAVLGQISAGVSHEINQPLTALRALSKNTTVLLEKGRMHEALENLKAISAVTERMGRITAQLKSFARKGHLANSAIALDKVIDNVQLLLEHRIRNEQVDVQVNASELPPVYCDSNRLEQVLINLCTNALDAMATEPIKVLTITAKVHDTRMLISVADTGPAVPECVVQRLFEPFFSTKPAGEGLGLGLVISANIIKEFGGELRVCRTGSGLVFEFDLDLLQVKHHV